MQIIIKDEWSANTLQALVTGVKKNREIMKDNKLFEVRMDKNSVNREFF